MEPAEAVEIARCAYKSHGYTFFDDHIYYPERIVELNKTDEMISAVAVTEDNIFMGHSALVYPSEEVGIAEFTFVFVNQEYRSQGCMKRIADFLFQCPKKKPLDGLYVYSVTNHEFTQRGMSQFDIRDCGLLLASSPETWVFKGIDSQGQRISVALSFKYLTAPPILTLYPPTRHRTIIERLHQNLGAQNHSFRTPDDDFRQRLPAEAEIRTDVHLTENCAEIHVLGYGNNVVHEIRRILRELCLKNVAAIQLFLNLKDPHTFFMTAEFEKMGFFFAGILPLALVGDVLILQYLNNVRVDYDKIVLYTEEARQIRDYVREMDPNRDFE
jgi:serine/threonine-protein kinase RsbW